MDVSSRTTRIFCLEQYERRRRGFEPQLSPSTQHDNFGIMFEEFADVARLNAWAVMRSALGPVPLATATGPELGVAEFAHTINLEMAPAMSAHPRRSFVARHGSKASDQRSNRGGVHMVP
jgi:hypothetical protein